MSRLVGTEQPSLVSRAKSGDRTAWREIHARHAPVVRRVCLGFATLSADEAEDCVQETFVRAFESMSALKSEESLRPWLLAIARSRCLSRLERQASERRVLSGFFADPAAGAPAPRFDAELGAREARGQMVRALIAGLPVGPERETVELFYLGGELSAREIAERMGVGKSTVTMRLERFRARVKRRLAAGLARLEEKES